MPATRMLSPSITSAGPTMSGARRWVRSPVAARPASARPASSTARARRFKRATIQFRLRDDEAETNPTKYLIRPKSCFQAPPSPIWKVGGVDNGSSQPNPRRAFLRHPQSGTATSERVVDV